MLTCGIKVSIKKTKILGPINGTELNLKSRMQMQPAQITLKAVSFIYPPGRLRQLQFQESRWLWLLVWFYCKRVLVLLEDLLHYQ